FQAEDGIRDYKVTGVQTCALPISMEHADETPAAEAQEVVASSTPEAPADGSQGGEGSEADAAAQAAGPPEPAKDLGPETDEPARSEERRVGKECRSRWATCREKKK